MAENSLPPTSPANGHPKHEPAPSEHNEIGRDDEWLAAQFEANRPHLHAVAYRMLGSLSDADDAVQEAWLRLHRTDTSTVTNLGGWLTTVVARLCLDMLRARKTRREESLEPSRPDDDFEGDDRAASLAAARVSDDPEAEALLADSVGLALLVVLETLTPAERLVFVLHDLFAVPFDEIAPIVDRSPTAARQLASRARRRVQGGGTTAEADLARQRRVVDAFLTAARQGDFAALLTVLDPDAVQRIDRFATPNGVAQEMHGAAAIAQRASRAGRGGARAAQLAMINGEVGVVVAPQGRLVMVLSFTIDGDKIVAIDAIADPERLAAFDFALLPE